MSEKYGGRFIDLTGKKFGKLTAIKRISPIGERVQWLCKCDCGNELEAYATYLGTGDTRSCGCLKKETESINLREKYDDKRIEGVVKPLFKGKEPRKDSSTGFRGVNKYYTRVSREERYRAWITIKGKRYYKAGFLTAYDAYHIGRVELERKHLPNWEDHKDENS